MILLLGQDDEATEDKEVKRESGESDGSDSDSDDDADVSKVCSVFLKSSEDSV